MMPWRTWLSSSASQGDHSLLTEKNVVLRLLQTDRDLAHWPAELPHRLHEMTTPAPIWPDGVARAGLLKRATPAVAVIAASFLADRDVAIRSSHGDTAISKALGSMAPFLTSD